LCTPLGARSRNPSHRYYLGGALEAIAISGAVHPLKRTEVMRASLVSNLLFSSLTTGGMGIITTYREQPELL